MLLAGHVASMVITDGCVACGRACPFAWRSASVCTGGMGFGGAKTVVGLGAVENGGWLLSGGGTAKDGCWTKGGCARTVGGGA